MSYARLKELETTLRAEVMRLFELGERADQGEEPLPEGVVIQDEIAFRKERLENLAKAKAVLEARAKECYEIEKAEYDAKLGEREAKARKRHQKPRGKTPKPPEEGPGDKDQYNFTDPDSRIMKNSTNEGYDQHYNAQVVVTQDSLLILATSSRKSVTNISDMASATAGKAAALKGTGASPTRRTNPRSTRFRRSPSGRTSS